MVLRAAVVLSLAASLTQPAPAADADWSAWRTVENNISMRVKVGAFKYEGGDLQHSYQFRNDNDKAASFQYELHFTAGGKAGKETGTLKLEPNAMSNTSGAWVICDPAAGFSALIASIRFEGGNVTGASPRFSRPTITGIQLDRGSIQLLNSESVKLELAGYGKTLMAWSPLLVLAGENQPLHIVLSVATTSWEELGQSFSEVDKLVLTSLAQDARNHANSDELYGNPKAKQFWNAMADFYRSQAER